MRFYITSSVSFILLSLSLCVQVNGSIVSQSKYVMEEIAEAPNLKRHNNGMNRIIGQIRYHYDDVHDPGDPKCSYVVVVGVGTSMDVDEYDNLSHQIIVTGTTTSSTIVVISNHNVDGLVKTSSVQYANLINAIHEQLNDLIPVCSLDADKANRKIIVGGHSSSGQAAFEATQKGLFHFEPFFFLGLDPYDISENAINDNTTLHLPALYWGLTETTCLVNIDKAALGAYHRTSADARVIYSIDNSKNKMTHCVFTDRGCGLGVIIVCSTKTAFEWVYQAVGQSVHLFINALEKHKTLHKDNFTLPQTISGEVVLRVNEDNEFILNE